MNFCADCGFGMVGRQTLADANALATPDVPTQVTRSAKPTEGQQ